MDREAQEQLIKNKNKVEGYRNMCKSQFEENKKLKDIQKQKEV